MRAAGHGGAARCRHWRLRFDRGGVERQFPAARVVEYALPFMLKATKVTLLVMAASPTMSGRPISRAISPGRGSMPVSRRSIPAPPPAARAAGALLAYTYDKSTDLLVMGAYGRGQIMSFLGLGGATGKVISSCRVPLLLAH